MYGAEEGKSAEMISKPYLFQYEELVRHGLQNFDAWASTFGETVTAIELAPEGTGYRAKTRFAKFYNLPELMSMFKQVADIQTADMLDLPVPKANFHTEVIKPSQWQQDMVAELAERADKIRGGSIDPRIDNMLRVTNDGRKLALDQRIVNPLLPDDPDGKVAACAGNVFKIWEESRDTKSPSFMSSQKEAERPREFVLPPAGRCATHVVNYLRKRGIDADILNFCMQTGRLYESHPYHNAVFVGFDRSGTAKYAVQRGIGKTAFLGDADGSDKRYSFHIPAITPNDAVHLFESAVDLLSYATLQTLCGRNWREDNLLSLSGVYQPKKQIEESAMPASLGQYLSDYPHIRKIALHLDNDPTGRLATKAIQAIMPKKYEVEDEPPLSGKDYNDYLCDRLGLPRTKPRKKER